MINVDRLGGRRSWFRHANIPTRFKGVELTDLDLDGYDTGNIVALSNWIMAVIDGRIIGTPSNGLVLAGRPGHGKTALACAVLNEVLRDTSPQVFRPGHELPARPAYFTTFPDLLDMHRELMDIDASTERAAQLTQITQGATSNSWDPAYNIQLLLLDDVGSEQSGARGWNISVLSQLLRRRYNLGLPTIITTNLLYAELAMFYGEATADLLSETSTWVPVAHANGSFRQQLVT